MTPDIALQRLGVDGATARIDEIVAAYVEVYAHTGDEFFGEERIRQQLAGHMQAPAWELVSADLDGSSLGSSTGSPCRRPRRGGGGC